MPGIVGIFGASRNVGSVVEQMVRAMVREPFHASGRHIGDAPRAAIGWVCDKGDGADVWPLWNARGDAALILSGEIASVSGLGTGSGRDAGDGKSGPGACRGRDLLELYDRDGPRFIERLNGWFSGVLIDIRRNLAMLFNDRFGLSRIYVHRSGEGLFFASEAKALLDVCPQLRQLDMRGVAETFVCGCVLQNRSLFSGITLLPPASRCIVHGDGSLSTESYFKPTEWETQSALDKAVFYERFKETFARSLPRYTSSDRPIGMSLTGGLDGRMIMAAARPAPGTLPCYSFGGTYRTCADVAIARKIAGLYGQSHETITVADEFLSQFSSLAEQTVYISDGAMDVSGAVELYVNRLARAIAPVRLTGNYGSEIVRSNVAFRPRHPHQAMLAPDFSALTAEATSTYAVERAIDPLSFIAFKQVPWHHFARLSVERSQLTVRSPFLDNDIVALMYRAPDELRNSLEPSLRFIQDGDARLAAMPTDRGVVYGDPSAWNRLNRLVTELSVKAEYAYDYGMPQRLATLDRLLAPLHLERLFLGRHKFYHFRVWYRDQLAPYVKEVLLDPKSLSRSYLDGREVRRLVEAHTGGRENWTLEIHRLLTLELLQRQLIER